MLGKPIAVTGLAVLAFICLAGCDPLTRDRFELIQVNESTLDDVEHTIGDPSRRIPGQWQYERPDRHITVLIEHNQNDVVTRKQWIDANQAEWLDSDPPPGDTSTRETTRIRTVE